MPCVVSGPSRIEIRPPRRTRPIVHDGSYQASADVPRIGDPRSGDSVVAVALPAAEVKAQRLAAGQVHDDGAAIAAQRGGVVLGFVVAGEAVTWPGARRL